jgi:hypothetical protein
MTCDADEIETTSVTQIRDEKTTVRIGSNPRTAGQFARFEGDPRLTSLVVEVGIDWTN